MKTLAPNDFAMSMVRSAEPESTTMISPFPSATSGCTLASVRPMFVSSLCVMITTERITMISRYPKRAGRAAPRRQANTGLDGGLGALGLEGRGGPGPPASIAHITIADDRELHGERIRERRPCAKGKRRAGRPALHRRISRYC